MKKKDVERIVAEHIKLSLWHWQADNKLKAYLNYNIATWLTLEYNKIHKRSKIDYRKILHLVADVYVKDIYKMKTDINSFYTLPIISFSEELEKQYPCVNKPVDIGCNIKGKLALLQFLQQ